MKVILRSLLALFIIVLAACDGGTDGLAPYEGERPLDLLKITQSFAPDIQWVGGRVAAIGVNRGDRAALDTSLVWLASAPGDNIDSHVTVGQNTDVSGITALGGTPLDSLSDNVQYTFWLATREALDSGFAGVTDNPHVFLDTTFTFSYRLRGTVRGGESVDAAIYRDQKLISDRIIIRWTPENVRFRRIALRSASSPGWDNLIWHVFTPTGEPAMLSTPINSTEPPPGATVEVPWPEEGIAPGTAYTLWMTADNWNQTFGIRAAGLAYIQIITTSVQP